VKVAPHVPALDGVRSFAIAGVLAIHAGFPGSQLGWIGVDLFFFPQRLSYYHVAPK